MQPKQDMPMPEKDDNALKYLGLYKDEKYTLDEQDIEKDHRDLVGKSLDIESHAKDGLSRYILQARFFASELSSSLKEVKFSK